jgi:hypothetical protein
LYQYFVRFAHSLRQSWSVQEHAGGVAAAPFDAGGEASRLLHASEHASYLPAI